MAQDKETEPKKTVSKKRSEQYEPPVTFAGTFEDMIAISATGAGAKKEKKSEALVSNKKK
jgi:hypothetical protein